MTVAFSSKRSEPSDKMMLVFSGKNNFGTFPCVSNKSIILLLTLNMPNLDDFKIDLEKIHIHNNFLVSDAPAVHV